jgi:hypothetical protein
MFAHSASSASEGSQEHCRRRRSAYRSALLVSHAVEQFRRALSGLERGDRRRGGQNSFCLENVRAAMGNDRGPRHRRMTGEVTVIETLLPGSEFFRLAAAPC